MVSRNHEFGILQAFAVGLELTPEQQLFAYKNAT